jgi:hypothetical protein
MKPLIYGLILGLSVCGEFALSEEHERNTGGDNLDMPASATAAAVAVPKRGQDMARVERQWGTPQSRMAAVGDPPISRWIYGKFTVYFEHSLVIHSVLHGNKSADQS